MTGRLKSIFLSQRADSQDSTGEDEFGVSCSVPKSPDKGRDVKAGKFWEQNGCHMRGDPFQEQRFYTV